MYGGDDVAAIDGEADTNWTLLPVYGPSSERRLRPKDHESHDPREAKRGTTLRHRGQAEEARASLRAAKDVPQSASRGGATWPPGFAR